ncbi:MAG: serine hydrolase [Oscillospiraceae bacterium]|nr:serine hydrolase [Oscillospiraceae bacterium]
MYRSTSSRLAFAALALLLALLMTASAFAASGSYDFSNGLEGAVTAYMAAHGLNENNFSMGFQNTVTGESWFYNPDTFFVAGSMYKLPLCMLYADMIAEGTRQPTDYVGNYTIAYAIQRAIANSDNDAADALEGALGMTHRSYRQKAAEYSGVDVSTLPESYYSDNHNSPRVMLGTLKHLYENSERYNEIIFWMTQAMPGGYFRKNPSPYTVAQKYGSFQHCDATCGIVYTPQPYLLVVFVNGRYDEQAIADMATLTMNYVDPAGMAPAPTPTAAPTSVPDQGQSVTLRDIRVAGGVQIVLDGKPFEPKNALGEEVEVFVYDGTTYLPLRALSEALGFDVEWDGDTRTVYVTSPVTEEKP